MKKASGQDENRDFPFKKTIKGQLWFEPPLSSYHIYTTFYNRSFWKNKKINHRGQRPKTWRSFGLEVPLQMEETNCALKWDFFVLIFPILPFFSRININARFVKFSVFRMDLFLTSLSYFNRFSQSTKYLWLSHEWFPIQGGKYLINVTDLTSSFERSQVYAIVAIMFLGPVLDYMLWLELIVLY